MQQFYLLASTPLWQDLQIQETKGRIHYLHKDQYELVKCNHRIRRVVHKQG